MAGLVRSLVALWMLHQASAATPSASTSSSCVLADSAPTNGCGVVGDYSSFGAEYFPIFSPQIVSSVAGCANLCSRRVETQEGGQFNRFDYVGYCSGFAYSRNTSLCQLGAFDLLSSVNENPKSKTTFYDIDCFDCGNVCPQKYGAQLLDNGGFQERLLGPWSVSRGSIVKGHKSSRAFHCSSDSCGLSQNSNLCAGELYMLQFDYLLVPTETDQAPSIMHFSFGENTHEDFSGDPSAFEYQLTSTNTDPHAWKRLKAYYQVPSDDFFHRGLQIGFQNITSASVDNFYVARIPSNPPVATGASNLIENGGFENSQLAPWTTSGGGTVDFVSPGINSTVALALNFDDGYKDTTSILTQIVNTTPNTTYLVSADLQHNDTQGGLVRFIIGPQDDMLKLNYYFYAGNYSHLLNYSISFLIFTTHDRTPFSFQGDFRANDSSLIVDNFKMVQVAKSKYFY